MVIMYKYTSHQASRYQKILPHFKVVKVTALVYLYTITVMVRIVEVMDGIGCKRKKNIIGPIGFVMSPFFLSDGVAAVVASGGN